MSVWTIDAETGCSGRQIARRLADEACIPLVDCWTAVAARLGFGTTLGEAHVLEETASSRIIRLGLASGLTARMALAPELVHGLELPGCCRAELERVLQHAARAPCVILGHSASQILVDHPGAVHVLVRAPREWRVRRVAAERFLSIGRAEKEVARAERRRRNAARRIFGRGRGDTDAFHVVCDASRIPSEAIIELLLVVGGGISTDVTASEFGAVL
jgi:Cytidylate kinase-like family